MTARDTCTHLLVRLEHAMAPMERALALLDEEQLAYRPALACTPLGELVRHAYEAALAMVVGVADGGMPRAAWEQLSPDVPGGFDLARLHALAATARERTRALAGSLTEAQVRVEAPYFFGVSLAALPALTVAHQEFLHHRGQVCTYLRALGLVPPDVYADGL